MIRERDGYRLVHCVRDPASWPNFSDLYLEEKSTDAMGNERWVYVHSWCLPSRSYEDPAKNPTDYADIALKMLVDPTHPVKKARGER